MDCIPRSAAAAATAGGVEHHREPIPPLVVHHLGVDLEDLQFEMTAERGKRPAAQADQWISSALVNSVR
ncbi:MAG: hypothetical protein ACR2OB_05590 [Solirubrobacteraceae bacterium]